MAKRLWILALVVVLIASGVFGCSNPPHRQEEEISSQKAPRRRSLTGKYL